ncbi:M3 family metallopeptidase [Hyphococcus flavus]|uniref:oligopeptidase A n=1 Tax=Hyphococcus flavus TaxID=1866326 RepID=A0AAE9ZB77_9PROT|nr:M3 family metallopeptidase [Hyphococcus flavus]WDI31404.1 M3 family metallopeptidase [Hyphococcus flavus]
MRKKVLVSTMALMAALAACDRQSNETDQQAESSMSEPASPETTMSEAEQRAAFDAEADAVLAGVPDIEVSNPAAQVLLSPFDGPYQGVPHFDEATLDGLKPALEAGMAQNLVEIDAIANNPEPATFGNTIVAMEKAGDELGRVFTYWSIWSSLESTPEFRAIQQEMVPQLSEFSSKINQNENLFQRVKAVYENEEEKAKLTPEQQRLLWLTYTGFTRTGATLEGEAKERYAAINKRLAELQNQFANNVLADEEGYVTYLTEDQLGGLPASFVQAAAAAAAQRGREGEYAITNTRSSMDPFLTYSDEREIRETVWNNYYSRGDNGGEHDNNALIPEILKLRDERVALLGYDNFALWRLETNMAKTPERALEMMEGVWEASTARVREDVASMQEIVDAEGGDFEIQPWDYRYYMEKVRQAKYDLDSNEVKQYLQLDKLRDAMFFVAGEVFNFEFTPLETGTVPVYREGIDVWEVTDKTSGELIGLWYFDPFARQGKRSGAWASSFRSHDTLDGEEKVVLATNNSNFIPGAEGQPTLLSASDAETLFHEVGHALHALSSNVNYPTLNGGVGDYTEFQSQFLEYHLWTDEVIDNYLIHAETGEPIPAELVAKIKAASNFNEGFDTTEYLASALMDMRYHMIDPEGLDVDTFERETLAELGMPDEIVMRHRSPHFGHIFSGESYAARYYGYMWADVLTADTAEMFAEAPGGFYNKELNKRLVEYIFAPRNAMDPTEAYREFRGRDAQVEALMRDRGFSVPDSDE